MLSEDRLWEDEYEKQFYGFSSTEFSENFREQFQIEIYNTLKYVESELEENISEIIKQQILNLQNFYLERAEPSLQKFQAEVRKIFAVPSNVLLESDELQTRQFNDEEIAELETEVAKLEFKYIRQKYFLERCKQEKILIEKFIKPVYDQVNSVLETINCIGKINTKRVDSDTKLIEQHAVLVKYYFDKDIQQLQMEKDFVPKTK